MWLVKPGQYVAIRQPDGEDIPAIVRHIPTNRLDRRVLVELEGYQLRGRRSVVIRRSALRKRAVVDLTARREATSPSPAAGAQMSSPPVPLPVVDDLMPSQRANP